jgi:glutamate--cysteine ligase
VNNILKKQFRDLFEKGSSSKMRIGLECEAFAYLNSKRLPYDELDGVTLLSLLHHLIESENFEPIFDEDKKGNLIGIKRADFLNNTLESITLEPGGQFEYASPPVSDLLLLNDLVLQHEERLLQIKNKFGVDFLFCGYDSKSDIESVPFVPKKRYKIMKNAMNADSLGLHMMKQTCTVQLNFDYKNESDMAQKVRVCTGIQPIMAALFNGITQPPYMRSQVWAQTDPLRCGLLMQALQKNFNFDSYIDYVSNIPLYFFKKDQEYLTNIGTLNDISKKEEVTHANLLDALSFVFSEVRLKPYIELRSFDSMLFNYQIALAAFWIGILYDEQNCDMLANQILKWDIDELVSLYKKIPTVGLDASFMGKPILEQANTWIALSNEGLRRRQLSEERFLEPIFPFKI